MYKHILNSNERNRTSHKTINASDFSGLIKLVCKYRKLSNMQIDYNSRTIASNQCISSFMLENSNGKTQYLVMMIIFDSHQTRQFSSYPVYIHRRAHTHTHTLSPNIMAIGQNGEFSGVAQ